MYSTFSDVFISVLDRHVPLKRKMTRGNQGPFMTKQLSKAIINRSKLKKAILNGHPEKTSRTIKKQKT